MEEEERNKRRSTRRRWRTIRKGRGAGRGPSHRPPRGPSHRTEGNFQNFLAKIQNFKFSKLNEIIHWYSRWDISASVFTISNDLCDIYEVIVLQKLMPKLNYRLY